MLVRNVNNLWEDLRWRVKLEGKVQQSRNGKVIALQAPMLFGVKFPMERVLFCPHRQANPYLHVMEALWMLGGGQHVGFLSQFSKNMMNYAEPDTLLINGAYGHRWRRHFGRDQLMGVIRELQGNHESRQAVVAMYDPTVDWQSKWRDRPCNTHIYFRVREGKLDMTVCNRSNDLVWGACGANFVHMTYMQEFLAAALNLRVGRYWVMTNNLHVYEPHFHLLESIGNHDDLYPCTAEPVFQGEQSPWEFLEECRLFLDHEDEGSYRSPWINRVVIPMFQHYICRKNGDKDTYDTNETEDPAWQQAENLWRTWHG